MTTDLTKTMVELLRGRAETHAARPAFTYLKDGEEIAEVWTYQELDRRARQVAAALQKIGSDGDRAILLYPPGLAFIEAFFGCLYAERIAVPIAAPHPARLAQELPRVRAIVESADPRTLLVSASMEPVAEALRAADPTLSNLKVVVTDTVARNERTWRDPDIGPQTLAFLQYTSGSTALPKGVMVSHGNLLHNIAAICETYGSSTDTTAVSWLPVFHDMGLIGCVLHPMLEGASTVLMAPQAFLQRPVRWLQAISRFRAQISAAPNFAYDLCVRRITPEQRSKLDLRSWRVACNGAEPVRARTLVEFTRAFEPCGFRPDAMSPCYGLAEATLMVTSNRRSMAPTVTAFHAGDLEKGKAHPAVDGSGPVRELVGCGRVVGGQRVLIVDPDRQEPLPDGEVGEIWVAGPSVAEGYWRLPKETDATFGARLAGSDDGPFLRTGDLGAFRDGQLFITGRRKDLIIVDGKNHYPQDIELTVEQSHDAFRTGSSAAFSIDTDGAERVVVVAEADPYWNFAARGSTADEMATKLARTARHAVALNHGIDLHQLVLIRPGTIPKTTSGKIRRQACRTGFLNQSLQPWDKAVTRTDATASASSTAASTTPGSA